MPRAKRKTAIKSMPLRIESRARWCKDHDVEVSVCGCIRAPHRERLKSPRTTTLRGKYRRRQRRSVRSRISGDYLGFVSGLHNGLIEEQFIEGDLRAIEELGESWAIEVFDERSRGVAVEDPMAAWAKELRKRPLLTKEQEIELAKRIDNMKQALAELEQLQAENNLTPERESELYAAIRDGEEAREILIESNLRLVVSIARKYRGYGVPLSDLIQEGNIGLIQAVDKFDWRKGCRFSTCATLWIRQAVIRAIQAQAQLVKLPTRVSEQIHRLSKVKDMLTQELGREPTVDELARRTRLPKEVVEQLLCYPHQVISLDEPVDTEEKMTLADAIEDECIAGPEEIAIKSRNRERIERALRDLPDNQRLVIRLRYGLEDGHMHTYEDIGKRLSLSRQRVKQIADAAIKRLKEHPLLCGLDVEGYLESIPARTIGRRI